MNQSDYSAQIFYHFYNKYYGLMLNVCKEAISKISGNISFRLYHSLALYLTNRLEEGVHDLEIIREENDVKLASTIALMYGHKFLGVPNRELYSGLDVKMKEHRRTALSVDFYYSAFVLVALNKLDKALDYIEKALSIRAESEYLTLKGWIFLMLKNPGKNTKTIFQDALDLDAKNLLAIIGYTESLLHLNECHDALNTINQAVIRYPATTLPLLQKIKIHFALQDFEETIELANKPTSSDFEILYSKRLEILFLLCKTADYKSAADQIKLYFAHLQKFESSNPQIFLETCQLFSKVCNKNHLVLKETTKALEYVIQTNSENADIVTELGYQNLLLQKVKDASRLFKSATKIDQTSFEALLGLSYCEFLENSCSEQLQKQISYLLELKDSENSPLLRLLQAKSSETGQEAMFHLKHICDSKIHSLKLYYYSDWYLLKLDPDFTLELVKEYLKYSSNDKGALSNVLEVLYLLVKACPGFSDAQSLLAKAQYLKGDHTSALGTLNKLSANSDEIPQEAGLIMAQIHVENKQFDRASQSLETCISHDFRVRENPIYHYITGLVDKNSNNYADAIKSFTTALNLVNITSKDEVSLLEKASLYVELIDTLNIVGQNDEAIKILEVATEELKGSPEESKILILSADNMLSRKNIQGALDLLGKIEKTDNCYKEARIKTAEILLKYRRDKLAFVQVYKDFVDENPCSESYLMLGDAYMTILEPDDALDSYQMALKENPTDPFLTSKMGKALVDTHYFSRAVDYYKKAIKETRDSALKLQLAELYLNLREYEKGELVLLDELEEEHAKYDLEDLTYLQHKTKLLYLLARIQEKSGNLGYAEKTLKEALENQNRVRKRLSVEQNVVPENELNVLIDITLKLGEISVILKNNERAVSYYKESLNVSSNNVAILVALARLYMQMNQLEQCQQTCLIILRIEPENESASVMMADIAFRKVDFDMALFHFSQLITKQPTNWEALVRLIEISRRMGNIANCEEYLAAAEKHCVIPSKEPGLIYCRAFYEWHSGNLNAALKDFNQVRQDPDFGERASYGMIEICLNPDDEMLAEQIMESDDIEYRDSRTLALKTADRLIKELKQRLEADGEDLFKCRLLSNFRLLATKEKYNIERALEDFVSIASQVGYKENIGAILGMSTAHTLLKQGQRAKNQLKRVVKTPWTFEDADYLEKCWLMLADHYIQSGKLEPAQDLISKVVEHNKACTRAYEYLGAISEKDHNFKEAAANYQQAWKIGSKTNPTIGFKLAYCLMKCKKYPDAIDTANEVLKLNPDYPNVKKDILDKSVNNLRI